MLQPKTVTVADPRGGYTQRPIRPDEVVVPVGANALAGHLYRDGALGNDYQAIAQWAVAVADYPDFQPWFADAPYGLDALGPANLVAAIRRLHEQGCRPYL